MKEIILRFFNFFNLVKANNLAWHLANQDQIHQLSRHRSLAKEQLAVELKLKSLELEHDIAMLKTRQAAELTMLKTRCAEDIKDYQQYLKSLEQLKILTQSSFSHLPEAMALTIHHHAKSLLNQMWETEVIEEKIRLEAQLVKFMTTLHEEAYTDQSPDSKTKFPENTLKLMEQLS